MYNPRLRGRSLRQLSHPVSQRHFRQATPCCALYVGCLLLPTILATATLPPVKPAQAFEATTSKPTTSKTQSTVKSTTSPAKRKASKKRNKKRQRATQASHILEKGIAATQSGKHQAATALLSKAIETGALRFKDTARALYYRGKSYRHLGKQALAIADLTSALWKKGALTGSERQGALAERAAAYRQAGLGDQNVANVNSTPDNTAKKPLDTRKRARSSQTAPRPKRKKTPQTWTTRTRQSKSQASTSSATTQGTGSFFTTLFGSTQQAKTEATRNTSPQTKSVAPRKEQSWSTVARPSSSSDRSTRPSRPKSPNRAQTNRQARKTAGRLRVQVAAVHNQSAAEALAKRISQRHATLLASRKPAIKKDHPRQHGYHVSSQNRPVPFAKRNSPSLHKTSR